MIVARHFVGLTLLTLLASTGCRSSDPLAGTWANETCYGSASMPDDVESCEVALTFTDGLEVSLAAEWVSLPATADFPGCITTNVVSGQTWSTQPEGDHDVLTIDGAGTATTERNGCVNAEDNLEPTETTSIALAAGETDYELSGNVLTLLEGDLAGSYSK